MTECWRISTCSRVGDVLGVAIGPHVERDDDRIRRGREQHVGLVHRADARVDDPDLDLFVGEFGERVGQHLGRSLHVGLDDDRQLLHAAFGDLRLQRFERQTAALARRARGSSPAPRGMPRSVAPSRRRRPGRRRQAAEGRSARGLRPASTARRSSSAFHDRRSARARVRRSGPAMNVSPTASVPSCTSTVATGPRPLSSFDSSTVPGGVASSDWPSARRGR